jgi:hypothetical protein
MLLLFIYIRFALQKLLSVQNIYEMKKKNNYLKDVSEMKKYLHKLDFT